MSELAIVAIVLLAISLMIYVIVGLYNKHMAAGAGPRQWTVDEIPECFANGDFVQVVIKRGKGTMMIGPPIACDRIDFDDVLTERRVLAEDRALTLNRGLNS